MKILIVAFISVFFLIEVLPAQATVINRDEANDYFSSCMSKKSADVKEETMTTLCACTSAKMVESMTSEELQTMAGTDATAQDARRKMLLEVQQYQPPMLRRGTYRGKATAIIYIELLRSTRLLNHFLTGDFVAGVVVGCDGLVVQCAWGWLVLRTEHGHGRAVRQ